MVKGKLGGVVVDTGMARSLDIYTEHFGLSQRPFSLQPDPDFLFWSTPAQERPIPCWNTA